MEKPRFNTLLVNWYHKNKRPLPWRESQDPYRVWLSEVLLQQTKVAQGLPYYMRFLDTFPDIKALANASEKDVLRVWQGLGYYSRARNLHFASKTIFFDKKGIFPNNYDDLLKLKGVGTYTAAAIASFAYNQNVAVVDGNVYRVLSRVFGVKDNIASPSGQKKFQTLADKLLPKDNSATYNQAIMEFGALQCIPKKPNCENCPLSFMCFAYAKNSQEFLPVKVKNNVKTIRHFHYLAVKEGSKFLMKERKGKDIWKGLYEFPLIERSAFEEIGKLVKKEFNVEIKIESKLYKHVLSHQYIFAKFWVLESKKMADVLKKEADYRFYSKDEIKDLPKSILINKFLEESVF